MEAAIVAVRLVDGVITDDDFQPIPIEDDTAIHYPREEGFSKPVRNGTSRQVKCYHRLRQLEDVFLCQQFFVSNNLNRPYHFCLREGEAAAGFALWSRR